jgi:hypothetical protein
VTIIACHRCFHSTLQGVIMAKNRTR